MRVSRQNVSGNSPWEPRIGFSRAVRVGNLIVVAGTVATGDKGEIVGLDDPYAQARQALRNIELALHKAGAGLEHVVRTRMYITSAEFAAAVGSAHAEVFGAIRPAASMLVVKALVDPEMLVEIEADAVLPDPPPA
jgi:enamine deaminase RidA (YjgF/YER057c/UK114 family)